VRPKSFGVSYNDPVEQLRPGNQLVLLVRECVYILGVDFCEFESVVSRLLRRGSVAIGISWQNSMVPCHGYPPHVASMGT